MTYNHQRALALLQLGSGQADATFRDGQEEAIRHLVEGQSRLLVVQKTGWGKSFVYFIAAKLLREAGQGPALLISPLLSLMRNQIAAAERMGVRAVTINSSNVEEWAGLQAAILRDEVDVVLISPERLANDNFMEQVLAPVAHRIASWSSMRPTASLIGVTTFDHIIACSNALSGIYRQTFGCSRRQPPRTIAS